MTRMTQVSVAALAALCALIYYKQGTRLNAAALEQVEALFDALDGSRPVATH